MSCPNCGGPTVAYPIPDRARTHCPDDRAGAEICADCLTVSPLAEPPTDPPDFDAVLTDFPAGEAGAIAASLLGLLDSLALYRGEIEALARLAEQAGVDVFLLLDRLDASGRIQPHFDIDRRRHQLDQLL
ncbi:DUF6276 family protein [Halodesulfurarchaeum sp. HSR-GB]|uniref:DUF6276 family protein n=1 Tax=Halodesulfurarchaeum sp. HSR-GB TaxID=3074077 RepID=UPI002867A4CD|nr:DUF6276 family protein [Halodesulfurarchaeum sp. HSR-GB]MDR5656418.1 DUF6276 family protein [Halodesulfurarchaeum sp. HSR-GB]